MEQRRNYYFFIILSFLIITLLIYAGKNISKNDEKSEISTERPADTLKSDGTSIPAAIPASEIDPDWLLPDLQVQTLDNAQIVSGANNKRSLRFPGTFINTGDGPLELAGSPDKETNTIRATQRVFKKNGSPDEKLVGNFIFHPTHNHWHFENFVEFELWSLKSKAELDQKIIGTGKMTFCIHDYAPLPDSYPGKPENIVYPWCDSSADIQGISVGWEDTYKSDVPGQELDISSLPDGKYAFRSIVDPENLIIEKDERNNSSVSIIEIVKNTVRIFSAAPQ